MSQVFTIDINAPKAKVWEVMLGEQTYRQWTAAFHAGSRYEGSWEQGSDIRFVAEDDGVESGMAGKIAENRPQEYLSIEYIGEITDGRLDTDSDSAKQWVGAHENYDFEEQDGVTTLTIELEGDIDPEMADMFAGMWPPALAKLKEIAERP